MRKQTKHFILVIAFILTIIIPAITWARGMSTSGGFISDPRWIPPEPVRNEPAGNSKEVYYEPSDSSIDLLLGTLNTGGKIYYVNQQKGDNSNDGLSRTTPFQTIQKAVNMAKDNDTILVWPGVYSESIFVVDKAITIQSVDYPAVLEKNYDDAIIFYCSEGKKASLKNFIIRNSTVGIHVYTGSPFLCNLTIVDCDSGIKAEDAAKPEINSCILWNNSESLVNCKAEYSYAQKKSIRDIVSYWKLDGNAIDFAGINNGIVHGTRVTESPTGQSLDFDGIDDYIEIPDSDSLTPKDELTLAFWLYSRDGGPSGVYKRAYCPDDRDSPGNSRSYAFHLGPNDGKMIFIVLKSAKSSDEIRSNTVITPNQWYHVAATFNKGKAEIYINGRLDSSKMMSITSITNDVHPMTIGAVKSYCDKEHFEDILNGRIDEVMIYSRALNAGEIETLYGNDVQMDFEYPPLFADQGKGDYHLLSERGRFRPSTNEWLLDYVTSPCIDGGDPDIPSTRERKPNGGRVNMGALGGTPYASMSE